MQRRLLVLISASCAVFSARLAAAHVTIASGPAIANTSQVVTFTIAHGCPGALAGDPDLDTIALTIDIPANVTAVRAVPSAFGKATVQKTAGAVTSVTWTKPTDDQLATDDDFYTMSLRLKTPNFPFAQIFFASHQTCKRPDGTLTTVDWIALPGDVTHEPAAALTLVPPRLPGWNTYTIGQNTHVPDMTIFFQDAQIVWRDNAAYSFNPAIATAIATTPGVTALTGGVHPDDVIWVKY